MTSEPQYFSCSLCSHLRVRQARVLPCGHTFCAECIMQMTSIATIDDHFGMNVRDVECATCRQFCHGSRSAPTVNHQLKQLVEEQNVSAKKRAHKTTTTVVSGASSSSSVALDDGPVAKRAKKSPAAAITRSQPLATREPEQSLTTAQRHQQQRMHQRQSMGKGRVENKSE